MWFRRKKAPRRGTAARARNSLATPQEFRDTVLPELARRWDRHCFCRNPQFLKLISFNFQNYGIAPMALADCEILIYEFLHKRFERAANSQPEWVSQALRCSQCGTVFRTRYDQYSINMDRVFATPEAPLPAAPAGLYLVGFHRFAAYDAEIGKITDFRLADSVESFIGLTSRPD